MMKQIGLIFWAGIAVVFVFSPLARATPANKAAIERHLDRFLVKNLQSCSLCHLPGDVKEPESLEEFPHNPFGDALRLAGRQLKADGRKRDIPSRLEMIGAAD